MTTTTNGKKCCDWCRDKYAEIGLPKGSDCLDRSCACHTSSVARSYAIEALRGVLNTLPRARKHGEYDDFSRGENAMLETVEDIINEAISKISI